MEKMKILNCWVYSASMVWFIINLFWWWMDWMVYEDFSQMLLLVLVFQGFVSLNRYFIEEMK